MHVSRNWAFCIFGQWFYPNFWQIFFIRERKLSSTILVVFRQVKIIMGKGLTIWLTYVAPKHLCPIICVTNYIQIIANIILLQILKGEKSW